MRFSQQLKCGMLAMALLAGAPMGTYGDDWPQLAGPKANGISAETGINTNWSVNKPPVLWKSAMHDDGYSSASVVNGVVYIVDFVKGEDVVRALDLKTGEIRWERPYPAESGAGHTRGCPVFDQGKLYVYGIGSFARCLDATSGKMLWVRDLKTDYKAVSPDFGCSASPYVDDKQVIFVPGGRDGSVVSLDKLTGATIWKSGNEPAGHATPVLATINKVRQYVIFNGYGAVGVKTDDGTQLWRHQWTTQHNCNAGNPVVIDNTVFISSGYGVGCAMLEIDARWKVKELWKNKELINRNANPILYQGYIYSTDETDRLVCLDPKSKAIVWAKEGFGAPLGAAWKEGFTCGSGGLLLVDGTLLVVSETTKSIVAVKATPKEYQELGRLKMPFQGDYLFTAPSLSDGKFIVRDKRSLFCVDLSANAGIP